ncbi:PLD nuclease N-terminal domain-containing protein [uncultured Amnibacterium sp.]|uniref:PLD nuclease N-terminal domain-containing protein n=1 Tax=uncultured Amnibacterium sp. TaxID=1631851 RepID=UPI0035CA231C
MGRLEVLVALAVLVLEIFAVVNCALMPDARVRGIPKALWLIAILIFPLIGSVLWLAVGRERIAGPVQRKAPDDDARFLGAADGYMSKRAQDERIRQMEEDLARLERESDDDAPGRPR